MAYYLKMDGVDDYIKLPFMTLNRIVIDMRVRRKNDVVRLYHDFRTGIAWSYIQQNTNGTDSWQVGSVRVDGKSVSNGTAFMGTNERKVLEHTIGTTGTDDGNIFSNNAGGAGFVEGDIYDIKIYNGSTLVAHYDMSTGTVQDQSGNGNHATLIGGTWVDDGTGGGGTEHTLTLSDSLSVADTLSIKYSGTKFLYDTLSTFDPFTKRYSGFRNINDFILTSDSINKRLSAVVVDTLLTNESTSKTQGKATKLSDSFAIVDSIRKTLSLAKSDAVSSSEHGNKSASIYLSDSFAQVDSISVSGGKLIALSDSLTVSDSLMGKSLLIKKSDIIGMSEREGHSVSRNLSDILIQSDSTETSSGKSHRLEDSVTISDSIIKKLIKSYSDNLSATDSASKTLGVRLYDVVLTTETLNKTLPNAPVLIGTIELTGEQVLYVYLYGSRELDVNLRGELKLTVINQDFSMYSGDSKNIIINVTNNGVAVDLTGATVKWLLKKTKTNPIIKDNNNGIVVENPKSGKFTVSILPDDTTDMSGRYFHEAEIIDANGNVSTILTGVATITRGSI